MKPDAAMKRSHAACAIIFLFVSQIAARAATGLERMGSPETTYVFPAFTKGTVYFRNGTHREALLNYHRRDGQLRFMNARADTLTFTGKYLIGHVEIAGRTFLLSETHADMEVISTAGKVMLAERVRSAMVGTALSHSGQQFSASAGQEASGLMVSNREGDFQWQNNASLQRWRLRSAYFLRDSNGIIYRASRRAFLKVFARQKQRVARYIRTHRPDFNRSSDLHQLFAYCTDPAVAH